ncbi:MAG: phospholipid carrier-dependent glycosyltransferase [Isosphaeraceae bacterium]
MTATAPKAPGDRLSWLYTTLAGMGVAIVALGWFGLDLPGEEHFVDESAYYSQSYFAGLYLEGAWNSPAWLTYPAYDLPPLPKYLIGLSLSARGIKPPGPADAYAWYRNTASRFDPLGALAAARVPFVGLGVLGCLAVFGLGLLCGGRRHGAIAAVLLTFDPLYRMLARRAMSDVPCEAFVLTALVLLLWAWTRILSGRSALGSFGLALASGAAVGLALSCKMSGLLAVFVGAAWVVLGVVLADTFTKRLTLMAFWGASLPVAAATMVLFNPFLTAQAGPNARGVLPEAAGASTFERARMMMNLRLEVARGQQTMFPHNALTSPADKIGVALAQGFGRFGPFGPAHSDSRRRYDPAQDWGALLWLPCVAIGFVWSGRDGLAQFRSGRAPTSWALVVQGAVTLVVVTAYLPLAWDRYFLALQAPFALLAAALWRRWSRGGSPALPRPPRRPDRHMALARRPETWVFCLLLASYAYFWQARDWNSASRLMLTYAIVDNGTVAINGYEDQTGDRAYFRGRFFTDKLPGYPILAVGPYALARVALRLPPHPVDAKGLSHWPADYWVTLCVSGVLTAGAAVVLYGLARDLGCGPRRCALVALAYGLGTPAYAYATMSHGHQATSFALIAAFALLWRYDAPRPALRAGLAGFLASYASVIELQVGPVSAVLGFYLLAQTLGRKRKVSTVGDFAVGAVVPALVLGGYNQLAFGSPFDMGYFHHTTKIFADVHSSQNPLGLKGPEAAKALALLWGGHRGLFFFAPITLLVPLGLFALVRRGFWGAAIVSTGAMAAVFGVNLSYPEWTGGWSTGPRLLVPLLPFAMVAVAGALAWGGRWLSATAAALALAGAVLMALFVGVGGRVPQFYLDPLMQVVLPLWSGRAVPGWIGEPFARNLIAWSMPGFGAGLPPAWRGLQFAPLFLAQAVATAALFRALRPTATPAAPASDLRVDQ